jgi:hypothetical protein
MRLSLWTQYSSNNSNDFDLVGEFKTSEEAQQRGLELRTLLERIEKFYVEEGGIRTYKPQQIDAEISREYAVEIRMAIDWLYLPNTSQRALRVLDNRLYLSSLMMSVDAGHKPFDEIIERMGAKVLHTGAGALLITLTCIAPNASIAQDIIKASVKYWQKMCSVSRTETGYFSPPWIGYLDGQYDAELAELAQKWRFAYEQDEAFIAALESADELDEKYDAWQKAFAAQDWRYAFYFEVNRSELGSGRTKTSPQLEQLLRAQFDAGTAWGWIFKNSTDFSQDEARITLKRLSFYNPGMALEAVMAWLSAQGCTQIQHTYEDGYEVLKANES